MSDPKKDLATKLLEDSVFLEKLGEAALERKNTEPNPHGKVSLSALADGCYEGIKANSIKYARWEAESKSPRG